MASKAISSCKSRLVGNIIYDILRYQHVNPYYIIIKFFLHLSMWDEVAGWITQSQDPKADIGMQCNALLPNLSSFKKLFSTDHKQLWSYMKDILYLYEEETRIKVKIWLELKGVPEGVHEGWGHISPYIPCLVFIRTSSYSKQWFIVSILGREEGYMVKYDLSPRDCLRTQSEGNPKGSGLILPYIPTWVLIRTLSHS